MLNLLKTIGSVINAERLEPEKIKALQEARFRNLLRHTLKKSVFYKRYYAKHGITSNNIDTVLLNDIPTTDKELMIENFDELVCVAGLNMFSIEKFLDNPENRDKKYKNRYHIVHTSGTTRRPSPVVYSTSDWDVIKALGIIRVSRAKINPFNKTKLAFLGAIDGHYAGVSLIRGAPRALFDTMSLSTNQQLQETLKNLNRFQPNMLSGYASSIELIAKEQISGYINIKPKRVICSGDILTDNMRTVIKEAFGVEPTNFYAASEALSMAVQCESNNGMHLFTDWHLFEVVDDNLKPVPSGKPGNLLVTNLYNHTQPIIRYRLGDIVALSNEQCLCGWQFPLIKHIAGRQNDILWFKKPDGSKEYIHWSVVLAQIFPPGLKKYQIVQTYRNNLTMKAIIPNDVDTVVTKIYSQMEKILSEKGLDRAVRFDIEVVREIPNDPKTEKFKFIIPYKKND